MDPRLRADLERLPGWSFARGRFHRPVPRPAAEVRAALRTAGVRATLRPGGRGVVLSVSDAESARAAETALLPLV